MSDFRNKWFEKNIKWQLHSLIVYIIYPEFRYSRNIKSIIYSNKYLIYLTSIILISLISSFYIGRMISVGEIKELRSDIGDNVVEICRLNKSLVTSLNKISDISTEIRSRDYIQYKVISESKIEQISNLKSVPDSIFLLMVDEADKYKIPYVIFFRVMERESKFQFVSNTEGSGAMGYMQVVRSTFSMYYDKLKLVGGHTPGNNIRVSADLISSIHDFWESKFVDDRKIWEYTLSEYACGRAPMSSESGYFIPESVKGGIDYVMKYYVDSKLNKRKKSS